MLLLNNFYEGDPNSLKNIEKVKKQYILINYGTLGIKKDWWVERREVSFEESTIVWKEKEQWLAR